MPRHLIIIALLLSMLMQVTSFGSSATVVGSGQAALHSLLHWAGLGHHHHRRQPAPLDTVVFADSNTGEVLRVSAVADTAWNSCDQDRSPESTQHLLMDGYISGTALIPSWPETLPADLRRPTLPSYSPERVPATPFLEGLRRPPRRTA